MNIIQSTIHHPPMQQSEFKMLVWGNTVKAVEEYPQQFTRTECTMVQEKFEQHLHSVMHRAGEFNTDGDY